MDRFILPQVRALCTSTGRRPHACAHPSALCRSLAALGTLGEGRRRRVVGSAGATSRSPDRLSAELVSLLEDQANALYFSVVSLWEIVIKAKLGRTDVRVDPRRLRRLLVANGWLELPVEAEHVLAAAQLPDLHRDPFDRLLVAQSRSEGLTLATADERVRRYGEGIISS